MLDLIRQLASSGPLYVRLSPKWLSVRDTKTGRRFEDRPLVAITHKPDKSIFAVGELAEREAKLNPALELHNGFLHPRTIIADFTIAERTLQYFLNQVSSNTFIRPAPVLILHVTDEWEGGLTGIEVRALQELATGAGARESHIWTGRELTDQEIRTRHFPGDNWLPQRPTWVKGK